MLTEFQKAKLVEWAEWLVIADPEQWLPRGLDEIDRWVGFGGPFPTFDWDEPYTFGED